MQIKDALFEAFRQDHALLGRGLFALRGALVAGDLKRTKEAVEKLDREAGAHIAFEERDFYPALKPFLSQAEIDDMYRDHARGFALISELEKATKSELLDPVQQSALIAQIEDMETHVSECGELFGAMGGLSQQEQKLLLERLNYWRQQAPRWTDITDQPLTLEL